MSTTSPGPEWSGEMLDRPEMVAAFAGQLRRVLSEQGEWISRIRREAEAMWKANPPEGYSSFEAWWRHRWITGPFGEIQKHIEQAATLTFALEARFRRGRHEIPAARQAAREARQTPAIPAASRQAQPRQVQPRRPEDAPGPFLDLIRGEGQDRKRRPA